MNEADLGKVDVPYGQPSPHVDVYTDFLRETLLGVVKLRLEIRCPQSSIIAVFEEFAAPGQAVHALIVEEVANSVTERLCG